jgi:hypothetical protein
VRPQHVTFIVPGVEDFKIADVAAFINKAKTLEVFFSTQLMLSSEVITLLTWRSHYY